MYINNGQQNLVSNSTGFRVIDGWTAATATYEAQTDLAPDGSSLAQRWTGNGTSWYVMSDTLTTTDPTHSLFIGSAYVKPIDKGESRIVLGINGSSLVYNSLYFDNGVLTNTTQDSEALYYGHEELANDWYRMWVVCDHYCTGVSTSRSFQIYPNAPGSGSTSGESYAIWGAQCEETKYRKYPGTIYHTTGTPYTVGDFDYINFTQLPSALIETSYDTYEEKKYIDGGKDRVSTYKDSNLRTLVWDNVNYQTHGLMLYKLRELSTKKTSKNSFIVYPDTLKRSVRQEEIAILDFRITYSTYMRDHASVEVDFVIVNSYNY